MELRRRLKIQPSKNSPLNFSANYREEISIRLVIPIEEIIQVNPKSRRWMMNPRRFLPQAALALLLFIFSLTLCAGTTGQIKGKIVNDAGGDPLSGVSVAIKGTTMGAKTNLDGDFAITSVLPGTYSLVVSSIGFESQEITDVKVSPNQTVFVDIRLKQSVVNTGKVTEVRGQKKGIDFLPTGTQTIKTQPDIPVAPVGDVGDLLKRETGKTVDSEGELHLRGGRSGETTYLTDGVQFSSPLGSREKDATSVDNAEIMRRGIVACPQPIQPKPKCPPYPYWPYNQPYDDMYFQNYGTNPFIDAGEDHLSTFAIDVDDASYVSDPILSRTRRSAAGRRHPGRGIRQPF